LSNKSAFQSQRKENPNPATNPSLSVSTTDLTHSFFLTGGTATLRRVLIPTLAEIIDYTTIATPNVHIAVYLLPKPTHIAVFTEVLKVGGGDCKIRINLARIGI
jgi:hypothetical protein